MASTSSTDRCLTIQQDLIEYLYQYNNYRRFVSYLTTHFAQENLAFIATIVVFRNAFLSTLTSKEAEIFEQLQRTSTEFLDKLYALKFDYLHDLQSNIQQKIKENGEEQVLCEIRDVFIIEAAENCINISWDARCELIEAYKSSEYECSNKFLYLNLFNKAILEIYNILDTQYITYCHQH
eukprot:UN00749